MRIPRNMDAMKSLMSKGAAGVATVLLAQVGWSAPLVVQNHSFEGVAVTNSSGYYQLNEGTWAATGWTGNWNDLYVVNNAIWSAIGISGGDGPQYLFFEPYGIYNSPNTNSPQYATQITTNLLQAGNYTLTVAAGYASGFANSGRDADLILQLFSYNIATSNLTILASNVVSHTVLNTNNGSVRDYSMSLLVASGNPYIGETIGIRLGAKAPSLSSFQNVTVDNVRLDWVAAAPSFGGTTLHLKETFQGTNGSDLTTLGWTNLASQSITISTNIIDSGYSAGIVSSPNIAKYRKLLVAPLVLPVGREAVLTAVLKASATTGSSSNLALVEMFSNNGGRWAMQVSKGGGSNLWSLISSTTTNSAPLPSGEIFDLKLVVSTKSASCYGRAHGATRWTLIQQLSGGATNIAGVGISLQGWQTLPNIDSVSLASYYKFPTAMWTSGTWIDQTGAWIPGTIAQDLSSRNIDAVVCNFDTSKAASSTQSRGLRSVLNQADAQNLRAILGFSPLIDSTNFASMTYLQKKSALQPFVQEAMTHSSLLMYYLKDEPATATYYDPSNNWVQVAREVKAILAELDPPRVSFTAEVWNGGRLDNVVTNLGLSIAAPEAYPLWNYPWFSGVGDFRYAAFPDFNNNIDLMAAYNSLYATVGSNAVIWPVIQAHQWPLPQPNWSARTPSPEELKCMTGIALALRAQGAFYFEYSTIQYYGDYPTLMPVISQIAARLRNTIGPILQETLPIALATTVAGGGSGIYTNGVAGTFEASDGTLYLIAVNRNHAAFSTLQVTVNTLVGGRTITISNVADVEGLVSVTSAKLGANSWRFTLAPAAGDFAMVRIGKVN